MKLHTNHQEFINYVMRLMGLPALIIGDPSDASRQRAVEQVLDTVVGTTLDSFPWSVAMRYRTFLPTTSANIGTPELVYPHTTSGDPDLAIHTIYQVVDVNNLPVKFLWQDNILWLASEQATVYASCALRPTNEIGLGNLLADSVFRNALAAQLILTLAPSLVTDDGKYQHIDQRARLSLREARHTESKRRQANGQFYGSNPSDTTDIGVHQSWPTHR